MMTNLGDGTPSAGGELEPSNKPAQGIKEYSYGHIRLDISNSVLPLDKLNSPSPSVRDGMSQETETAIRSLSCELIQLAGKLLKLPQVAMATGCVLFQRFYYAKSFVRLPFEIVAMSCVVLASKIEEAPRRLRDIINVFNHIKQIRNGKPIKPMVLDLNYINLKKQVITAERRVLKELGFCVHVKHPHKIIVMYLQWLASKGLGAQDEIRQMSWNFMNDSLRTDVFVRYRPEIIATACIYLSARKLKIPMPRSPSWFEVLGVEEDDIRDCCYRIVCLYNTKKAKFDELEANVESLKKKMDDERRANRENRDASKGGTPSQSSPASKQASPSNNHDKNGKSKDGRRDYYDDRRSDYEDEENYHYSKSRSGGGGGRKKHKRSRSRSYENRGRSRNAGGGGGGGGERKHKKAHKRRSSHSPISPYSPKKSKKHNRDHKRGGGRDYDDRDYDRRDRRSDPGANRGGCAVASDNPYYEDRDRRDYKSSSRHRDYHRR